MTDDATMAALRGRLLAAKRPDGHVSLVVRPRRLALVALPVTA